MKITTWLIIINLAVFIFTFYFLSSSCETTLCNYLALQPDNFLQNFYIWTLLTSMFMHGSFGHVFINMLALLSLGGLCESVIGKRRFFLFYILSGIVAGLFFVFLAYFFGSGLGIRIFGSPETFAVGASGAIFAIAGLFVILIPRARFTIIFFPFFSLPAYIMIPAVLVLTWIVSFFSNIGIGNTAHLGGFLCGIVYGIYLKKKYRKKVNIINQHFR